MIKFKFKIGLYDRIRLFENEEINIIGILALPITIVKTLSGLSIGDEYSSRRKLPSETLLTPLEVNQMILHAANRNLKTSWKLPGGFLGFRSLHIANNIFYMIHETGYLLSVWDNDKPEGEVSLQSIHLKNGTFSFLDVWKFSHRHSINNS